VSDIDLIGRFPGDAAVASVDSHAGGAFDLVDETTQDLTSTAVALKLAEDNAPGKFGVYYEVKHPAKNELEWEWVNDARSKTPDLSGRDFLKKRFAAMH
jgi:2-oxoglutarate ferredoxin oxidoreductase subunit beta